MSTAETIATTTISDGTAVTTSDDVLAGFEAFAGSVEPDGNPVEPYINGGLRGVVTISDQVEYTIDGQVGFVAYTVSGTTITFEFIRPTGTTTETYTR